MVLLELGVAEAISGDAAAAEEHLRRASFASGDPVVRARARRLLARMLLFTSAPGDAVAAARAAQRHLPADLADARAGLSAIELQAVRFGATDASDPAERLARARADAPTGGPGQRMLTAVASWDSAMRGGSASDACRLAREALRGGRLLTEDSGFTTFIAASTLIIAEADETVGLLEEMGAARRLSEPQRTAVQLLLGWNWLHRGELVEAEASLRRFLSDTVERGGTLQYGLGYARGFLTRVLIERGKVSEARELATMPLHLTPSSDPDLLHRVGLIEVLLAEARWDEAVAAIDDLRTRTRDVVNPAVAPVGSLTARALLGLGRVDEAIEAADAEIVLARTWGAPGGLGCSLRALGTALDAYGSPTCLDVLGEAVETTEGTSARVEHVKSLLALGSALRRRGRPGEARSLLRRAADLATVCGAVRQVERADAELAAAGGRRTTLAVEGPDALTPSERRVALLAAAGRTNREIAQELFVTPKTVEIHLSSTYRKLGIGSRRDLQTAGIS